MYPLMEYHLVSPNDLLLYTQTYSRRLIYKIVLIGSQTAAPIASEEIYGYIDLP